ncbi:MAG TPA: hypothetical protein VFC44_26840 [Candidatus Saccharimonadales bacterium]|nr:hypothetical protein [Candidatus Saccharimonadales bacterium]
MVVFMAVQWFFAEFLISPRANNWFFAGNRFWSYGSRADSWRSQFWHVDPSDPDASILTASKIAISWALAAVSSWIGLLLGGWMRKVQR